MVRAGMRRTDKSVEIGGKMTHCAKEHAVLLCLTESAKTAAVIIALL